MKRFTETTKWQDPWFRKLKPRHKCLWQYLCDACDQTGVIDADWDLISFQIGDKVEADALSAFDGRICFLENGKLFIRGFIKFQYGVLSHDCKPHRPILALCERHGIDPDTREPNCVSTEIPKGMDTLSAKLQKGTLTLEEKEKDKEKDKDNAVAFEKFWESYPRKIGKGAARNAWAKAKLPSIEVILNSLHKAKRSPDWLKEKGAYIPHPATWLNQGRWEDSGMDYEALTQRRVLGPSSTPQEAFQVDEHDALSWIAANYEVKAGVPYRDWPQNVQAEYRNQLKQLQAA